MSNGKAMAVTYLINGLIKVTLQNEYIKNESIVS